MVAKWNSPKTVSPGEEGMKGLGRREGEGSRYRHTSSSM